MYYHCNLFLRRGVARFGVVVVMWGVGALWGVGMVVTRRAMQLHAVFFLLVVFSTLQKETFLSYLNDLKVHFSFFERSL